MSTPAAALAYVAPWQSSFNIYATQIVPMTKAATNEYTITVPSGQWWRIIFVYADYSSSATSGDRHAGLIITNPSGANVLEVDSPAIQTASTEYNYVWGPNLSATSTTNSTTVNSAVASIPDLLWQWGYKIEVLVHGSPGDDSFNTPVMIAYQVYTQDTTSGKISPAPAPTLPLNV